MHSNDDALGYAIQVPAAVHVAFQYWPSCVKATASFDGALVDVVALQQPSTYMYMCVYMQQCVNSFVCAVAARENKQRLPTYMYTVRIRDNYRHVNEQITDV